MKNQLMWPAVGNKFLPEVLGRKRQEARHFFWRVLDFCVKSKGRCCSWRSYVNNSSGRLLKSLVTNSHSCFKLILSENLLGVHLYIWLLAAHKFSHLRAYVVFFSLVPKRKRGGFISILPAPSVKRT